MSEQVKKYKVEFLVRCHCDKEDQAIALKDKIEEIVKSAGAELLPLEQLAQPTPEEPQEPTEEEGKKGRRRKEE